MSILEDLKNTNDWSIRYGLWDKLFSGHNLFQELLQLGPDRIDNTVLTIEQINSSAQEDDKRPAWEWMTAQYLMTCAQVAYLTERTPERLLQLLHKMSPQAKIQANSDSDWQDFVKTSLYQFPWPKPLSSEWAWDAVAAFGKTRRRVLRREKIAVLLLENNVGITADLTLELVEEGRGTLYPNPETMSFVLFGKDFLRSEQNAIAFLCEEKLWPESNDIRWMITRKSHEPIFEIDGGSAGGAFALGLAKLLNTEL